MTHATGSSIALDPPPLPAPCCRPPKLPLPLSPPPLPAPARASNCPSVPPNMKSCAMLATRAACWSGAARLPVRKSTS